MNSSDMHEFIVGRSMKFQDYSYPITYCLYTYQTISKHLNLIFPTDAFGRLYHHFTFGKNKSFQSED